MGSFRRRQQDRILDCIHAMQEASTFQSAAIALMNAAYDIVDCDHCGYQEVDLLLNRSFAIFSCPAVSEQLETDALLWDRFLPTHPLLAEFRKNPESPPRRLSDLVDVGEFHRNETGSELFRKIAVRHQVILNLGCDPTAGSGMAAFKMDGLQVMIGLPLNRGGSDFTDGEIAVLATLQRLARPILRRRRAEYLIDLIDRTHLTPSLCGSLMRMGLTDRQAEVAFWMLKGTSNTDIGGILEIGAQTVRHHSMAIFARLGTDGRLGLQRHVIRSILKSV